MSRNYENSAGFRGRQWILAGSGLVWCLVAMGLRRLEIGSEILRFVIAAVGLIGVGGAIYWQLRKPLGKTVEQRLPAAVMVGILGTVAALMTWNATFSWDSIGMLMIVLAFVAVGGGLLIIVPLTARKVLASLMILYHFLGIATAVTAVPAGQHVPWLPTQVWTYFYRPYLSFMYLNNAYHFYSPEPGPPTLLWFRIEYEGEAKPRWVRLAERSNYLTRQQYQRFLAMTESVSVYNKTVTPPGGKIAALAERRRQIDNAAELGLPPEWWRTDEQPRRIPFYPGADLSLQYRPLNEMARLYLSGYVQHIARRYPSETNPKAKVKQIQVYELIHDIMSASQMSGGYDPLDPAMYKVFYLGRYNSQGNLIPPRIDPADRKTHGRQHLFDLTYQVVDGLGNTYTHTEPIQDLYLYWMLPMYRERRVPNPDPKNINDWKLIDSLQLHTGDNRETLWKRN